MLMIDSMSGSHKLPHGWTFNTLLLAGAAGAAVFLTPVGVHLIRRIGNQRISLLLVVPMFSLALAGSSLGLSFSHRGGFSGHTLTGLLSETALSVVFGLVA